jgi:hypothetical protein
VKRIFLRAARHVESGLSSYACTAIVPHMDRKLYPARWRARMAFVAMFSPSPVEPWQRTGAWFGSYEDDEARETRVLALCLAAVACTDGTAQVTERK